MLDQVFIVTQQELRFRELLVFFPVARHVHLWKFHRELIQPGSLQVVQESDDHALEVIV